MRFQAAPDENWGGVEPYTYELVDCVLPAGLEFHPNTRVLSGTPNAEYRGSTCTYRVTDGSSLPVSDSRAFVLGRRTSRSESLALQDQDGRAWAGVMRTSRQTE